MGRKIILNLAMSLDGFIADENGGYEWIAGDGNALHDTDHKWDYGKFLEDIDLVVMGRNCFDQNMHLEFKDKQIFIATSKPMQDYDNCHFIHDDICQAILDEQQKDGKNIYLFGGGILIDSFIKSDIIDEYIVGIIPIILGSGRPLFLGNNPTIKLKLEKFYLENGIGIFHYSKH